MDDLSELIKRIYEYGEAYNYIGFKKPLFRLTPYEHKIFTQHIINCTTFIPEYYGHLPTYMGVDFELVGKPKLFGGAHIRSDSGIELNKMVKK
jgi:hypothetical protein